MRILHVNKFLYRRGGAESYMEDLASLQAQAGHHVEFFAMAHPENRPARFGDAKFYGSTGAITLNKPIVAAL